MGLGGWAHLRDLDTKPVWLAGWHYRRVLRVAREIRERCGCVCWFDLARRALSVGYQRPCGRVATLRAFPLFNGGEPETFEAGSVWTVADIAQYARVARIDPETKERWAERHEREALEERRKREQTDAEEAAREAMARTDSAYERYSMGRHHRPFAYAGG